MASHLRRGFSMRALELTGTKFGRLTALYREGLRRRWVCRCDCGVITSTATSDLTSGNSRSCGCLKKDLFLARSTTHGDGNSRNRTYRAWQHALSRCRNPGVSSYANYGGRGIAVCDRWLRYENFKEDMGVCPDGLWLDRVDNNRGYEPGNCRWASLTEQARNKRTTKLSIEIARKIRADLRVLREIAEEHGVSIAMVSYIRRGESWKELQTDTLPPAETYNPQ